MRFVRFLTLAASFALGSAAFAQGQWVTIKGQVKLAKPPAALAVAAPINVTADKEHCLSKGPLKSDMYEVNAKNNGLKNVIVFLRPELLPGIPPNDPKNRNIPFKPNEINPALAAVKPVEHVIDQPCCQFVPRITLAKAGDTLVVKNSAPVNHNFKYDSDNNGTNNWNTPPGQSQKFPKPLAAEPRPIAFECNVHPWMKGQIRIYDHPYFALTDADGKFEIKDAPAGKYRIVFAHEGGFHKGAAGRNGEPIVIQAGADSKTMEMKPFEYEFPKP
jgi:hypothetical protein